MSLVAYAASSDEDSDCEEETQQTVVQIIKPQQQSVRPQSSITVKPSVLNGHISDDDDEDYAPVEVTLQQLKKPILSLPAPKNQTATLLKNPDEQLEDELTPTFAKLPMPRAASARSQDVIIEVEDDEFLRKKATPSADVKDIKPATLVKGPVKISIPSLKDFSDVDKELAHKAKNKMDTVKPVKGSGLLSMLPLAKSEQVFSKAPSTISVVATAQKSSTNTLPKITALIPDTVKNRRPAHNTECVDGLISKPKKPLKKTEKPVALVDCGDSEGSDEESACDFFSLNADEELPEVSTNEINVMVAKRAAQMADATNKYLNIVTKSQEEEVVADTEMRQAHKRYHEEEQQRNLDEEAMQALVGGSSKRRRAQQRAEINIMDISGDQVLPNRDEWMRSALATSTAYQATGVLVDEEPASGTRRKHQITYLAHKAKANEAELQAMWSANRQNRRATQSKYGF